MRRGLIDALLQFLRSMGAGANSGAGMRQQQPGRTQRKRPSRRQPSGPTPAGSPASRPTPTGDRIEYSPCLDGDPDPGEVVWTWVPYEEDPSQGKDRPVVIIGRRGDRLLGVPLTSKPHDDEAQVEVGRGPWDREGRVSYARVERLLDIDPLDVRREGAVLERGRFDAVVAGVQAERRR